MPRPRLALALPLAAALAAGAARLGAAELGLVVSSNGFGSVFRSDAASGSLQTFVAPGSGGLDSPDGVTAGPDGALYVCSERGARVLRFDGATGAYLGDFVPAGSGGLHQCEDLVFGPDGDLYVTNPEPTASLANDQVLRYDGTTGAFRGVFVPTRSGGLRLPSALTFGPGGDLFVASTNTSEVLRYDGRTGAFRGAFVAAGSGGLSRPVGIAFGAGPQQGGDLFVASLDTDQVLRYDGTTGAFRNVFVAAGAGGLHGAYDLGFGPDGDLYVVSLVTNQVMRYDGATGAFRGALAGSGLFHPTYLAFQPQSAASCAAGPQALCLQGSRFAVTAAWSTASATGPAQAVGLTGDTGYLWFFAPANVEVVVKVLDGCALGGHFWVFAGGLTNVAVTMTVTDTRTGAFKTYQNPQGKPFAPLQDTAAFPCP
jgi:DNA-binding beta-propeller fold protein YncE